MNSKKVEYKINDAKLIFSTENSSALKFGDDELLSNEINDITYNQVWYNQGYAELDFLNEVEFNLLKQALSKSIEVIIKNQCNISLDGFSLEKYHHYVKSDADHFKIVSKTRDLFAEDFQFPIETILLKLSDLLKFKLSDIDPINNRKAHIIVRINRPQSKDFNPPHKDIYEGVDNENYIPQFVNFWIPIAGVTDKSNLPISPKSHLINESLILRTFEGATIEGNKYRVRMIKSWNGDNSLIRSKVTYGQVLIFTSHLIHGLAVNEEPDTTRVSLEFRLFKSE